MKIIELDEVDSTNEYCKRNDCGEDIIAVARRQSAGKGTKGRSFDSGEGGLYVTIMRHYTDFPAGNAFGIMVDGCVAVCRTLESFGVSPVIRWANDVLIEGRKVSGTLIENTFSRGFVTRSITGIGINLNNVLPHELRDTAVSLCECAGRQIDCAAFRELFLKNVQRHYTVEDYKEYIDWLGRRVLLRRGESTEEALALDIDAEGLLVVDGVNGTERISSAEVSLRL